MLDYGAANSSIKADLMDHSLYIYTDTRLTSRRRSILKHFLFFKNNLFFLILGTSLFSSLGYAKLNAIKKYETSFSLGYNALIGSDSVHSSVNITTPLIPGIDFNYYYYEKPATLVLGIGYRNIKFNDDKENNIPIQNVGSEHDLNLKYHTLWDIFDRTRFQFGIRYLNHYFFQSKALQSFVETRASFGVIADLGLEYDLINSEDFTMTLQGAYGLAAAISDVKSGTASFLGLKMYQKYSPVMNFVYLASYTEIHTSTILSDSTIASTQGRADFNLKFGIEKRF